MTGAAAIPDSQNRWTRHRTHEAALLLFRAVTLARRHDAGSAQFLRRGLRWPAAYWSLVTTPALTPRSDALPNLNGLFLPLEAHLHLEMVAGAALAAAAWITLRRTDFRHGLAVVLVSGVLIGHHAYVQDCALLVPALLIVSGGRQDSRISALCLALLTPAPYLLLWNGFWIGVPARLLLLILFCVAASRSREASQRPTTDAVLVLP